MARRVDKQYQRKIAEAHDNHLSAVQRDHQQRSHIEEHRIRKEAAIEEARKKKSKGEEKQSWESQQKSLPSCPQVNVKVAETAAKVEAERIGKLKALQDECQALRSNPNSSK
jgi:nucleoporin GLE1